MSVPKFLISFSLMISFIFNQSTPGNPLPVEPFNETTFYGDWYE